MGTYYTTGGYIGRVVSQSLSESKQKGTPQFVLRVRIVAACDSVTTEAIPLAENQQHERSVYIYLTEKAMEMALKALKVLGFNRNSLKYLDPEIEGHQDLTGLEVPLYCKIEQYEGEDQERWSISTPFESKPVEPSSLKRLDALFSKGLKELVATGDPKATSKVNNALMEEAAATTATEDDAPF